MTAAESSLRREIDRLREKVERKDAALTFYGDPSIYEAQQEPIVISEGQCRISTKEPLVMLDRGRKAREAG